jgi:polyisoprenoid-binding protein YceI
MPPNAKSGRRETFSARATFDRQAFGLHWNQDLDLGGVVVGDNVKLEAHVEIIRFGDDA